MNIYQIILDGFDGSTDKTDHLVKWIASTKFPDVKIIERFFGSKVKEITSLDITINDSGIDLIITNTAIFSLYSNKI